MAIDVTTNRSIYLRCEFKYGFWNGATAPTIFYGPINLTKVEITGATQEIVKLKSNMLSSYGEILDSQFVPKDAAKINVEFNSMTGNVLSLLLGANASTISQTSGAVADELITPVLGAWIPLANKYITPDGTGTEITAKAGSSTIDPVNYEVDLVNGLFKATTATGVTITKISYTKSTRAGESYASGKVSSANIMLLGTGTEMSTQKKVRVLVHKAQLAPNGTIDPVKGEYLNGKLAGDLITPSSYSSPWAFEYLDLSA